MSSRIAQRGDIFWLDMDPSLGHEQQGRRPGLIISPENFNRVTGVPIVLPITTKGQFARLNGFAVELKDTATRGIVRCDQPTALDISVRNADYIETLDDDTLEEVMARVRTIFE